MSLPPLPEEIAARLDRPMPWWKLLDNTDLSGAASVTREASSFAQKLSKYRVAVVPDPRIDPGVTGDTQCIAFRVAACTRHVTHDYAPAKVQLERDLAFLMVKGRPSPRELNWVRNKGFEAFRLDSESRERLMACLELMLQEPMENAEAIVRAVGADKSIPWRGDQYARYRALCEADGPLDEMEIGALRVIKQDKGIPPKRQLSIFDEPSTYVTPTKPAPRRTLALMLDTQRIESISRQTHAVGQLLGGVFVEEPASTAADTQPTPTVKSRDAAAPPTSGGNWQQALDVAAQRQSWPADELFAAWESLGLMPQGILDNLNERALDACGELLFEGDIDFDINPVAVEALKGTA